jgi:hypothetical protein
MKISCRRIDPLSQAPDFAVKTAAFREKSEDNLTPQAGLSTTEG